MIYVYDVMIIIFANFKTLEIKYQGKNNNVQGKLFLDIAVNWYRILLFSSLYL